MEENKEIEQLETIEEKEVMKEQVVIEEEHHSKFDNLTPRTEMAEMSKDEKEKIKQKVLEEKEESPEILEEKSEKKHGVLPIIVTVLYTPIAIFLGGTGFMTLILYILDFNITEILFGMLFITLAFIPYILLHKAKKKKNNILFTVAVVYEIIAIVAVIIFFLIVWPEIQNSISNQWCGINGCMRNE